MTSSICPPALTMSPCGENPFARRAVSKTFHSQMRSFCARDTTSAKEIDTDRCAVSFRVSGRVGSEYRRGDAGVCGHGVDTTGENTKITGENGHCVLSLY